MSRPWIFICPSSRGIGRALARHLLRTSPLPILSTTRAADTSSTKRDLLADIPEQHHDRLHVVSADVTKEDTLRDAAAQATKLFPTERFHLHMGFALPGVLYPEKNPTQIEMAHAEEMVRVNLLGPLLLVKYFGGFLPTKTTAMDLGQDSKAQEGVKRFRLPPHAVFTLMSARVGSTSDNAIGGWYTYRASKAGVTSLARSFDKYLAARSGDNALAMAYHPGSVKTDLSKEFWETVEKGSGRLLGVEEAVEKMVAVVTGVEKSGRGRFWDWKGEEVLP
jgi:NAD(P)-dependent dehydrogenase (short-subunit alcohol dehydrogenase family)